MLILTQIWPEGRSASQGTHASLQVVIRAIVAFLTRETDGVIPLNVCQTLSSLQGFEHVLPLLLIFPRSLRSVDRLDLGEQRRA